MIFNPKRYELKISKKEEMYVCSSEVTTQQATIHSYKDLTIRKKYRKQTIRYVLFFLVAFVIGAICMFLFHYNKFAVGVTCFFGFVLCVNLLDLFLLKNATKKFDCYVCNLSTSELERIENATKDLYKKYRLIFLENEMIFQAGSIVYAFGYKAIESTKIKGELMELFDLDGNTLGIVASSGWDVTENPPHKKKTVSIINNMLMQKTKK